ncbi:MAG: bifunctional methylenetetrahydrofolate dehydrogenase/methenyltetrahydrofolate cyclohydrolase FolD [Bryobacteraceae bacterium]|nr:bifunctional methylenetetrahydrofolate dehydrogenase/methenyltetrahydrofolate cyclohydrolase FolD [Bryobacteraceae bacterium]
MILDGIKIRDQILAEAKPRVAALPRPPGLAVVLVGEDPASEIYVRNKIKACHDLGIHSEKYTPPPTVTTAELLTLVRQLNQQETVDSILVQMPLPAQVDTAAVLAAIDPRKDADGFHPYNAGLLLAGQPAPRACTPAGVMEILRRCQIPLEGKRAVVVGRSEIVGKPMALMLLEANCTVTLCHSRTRDLAAECRRAEILVAAIGKPAFLTREHISKGAVVIDVGINRITDPAQAERIFGRQERPSTIVGDAHPLHMAELASAYTPVPGGVGPLTIAMLMLNTIQLAERRQA